MRLTPCSLAEVHHRARRLAQIPLLAVEFGAHLGLTLEKALRSARTHLAAAQALLQQAVGLVAPLLARAQLPPRDHQRMPVGRRHRRDVDLPQVHSRDGSCGQRRRQRLSYSQRQAELIVIRPPGQLHPTQVGGVLLRRQRQEQRDRCPPTGRRKKPEGKTVSAWSFQTTVW
jgi:hypothetical protein